MISRSRDIALARAVLDLAAAACCKARSLTRCPLWASKVVRRRCCAAESRRRRPCTRSWLLLLLLPITPPSLCRAASNSPDRASPPESRLAAGVSEPPLPQSGQAQQLSSCTTGRWADARACVHQEAGNTLLAGSRWVWVCPHHRAARPAWSWLAGADRDSLVPGGRAPQWHQRASPPRQRAWPRPAAVADWQWPPANVSCRCRSRR